MRDFGIAKNKLAIVVATVILFLPAKAPIQERELSVIANKSQASMTAYREISRLVNEDETVVSDVSDAIWWYSERNSIWIPVHFDDLMKLIDEQQINYLYINDLQKYLSKFVESDREQFANMVEPVAEFAGPGILYRIKPPENIPTKII